MEAALARLRSTVRPHVGFPNPHRLTGGGTLSAHALPVFPNLGFAPMALRWRRVDWRQRLILMANATGPAPSPSTGAGVATTAEMTDSPTNAASDDDNDLEPAASEAKPTPPVEDMAALVAEHSDAVYRVALSVTRNPVLAEDVAQDALIKAWQALPSYRGEAPVRNWILRITHNTAISALRKRREDVRDPSELPERAQHSSIETQVQHRLAVDRFDEALNDLDETSRAIVVLREVEGLSYDEICTVLRLSLPTVKTRLLRARRQLANALEGWQP